MAAPVDVAHTHVHSMRLASGPEALVARVRLADGTAGFGFTLNEDAGVARDLAAWDALGQAKGVPLYVLLGGSHRRRVPVLEDAGPAVPPDWTALRRDILADRFELLRIDPFAWGSLQTLQAIAAAAGAFDLGIALLAPHAHPWELQACAALAATLKGEDTRIIVGRQPDERELTVSEQPGLGIDWRLEPGFDKLQWQG